MSTRVANVLVPRTAAPRWRASRAKMRWRLYITLLAMDVACLVLSMWAANWLYRPVPNASNWPGVVTILIPIFVGASLNARAYSSMLIDDPVLGVIRSLRALALATAVTLVVAFLVKNSAEFSRAMIAIGFSLSCLSLATARGFFLRRAHRIMGGAAYSVALIVDGAESPAANSHYSAIIMATAEIDPDQDCPDMFDRLAAALQNVDRVVVSCPLDRRASWVRVLKGCNVRSEILAPELISLAPLALSKSNAVPTMVVADGPLGQFDSFVKRTFDITIACLGCLLLAPVMLLIAIAIKMESRGPVLFVQRRIGQSNRQFSMFKFRSMRAGELDSRGAKSTDRADDRVTVVGKFIRKTSLDELPQLFNVLIGNMSVVGPRPHALGSRAENLLFWEVDDRYWHRHAAKPGLTGLAQIRGYRGATEYTTDLKNRLQADLEYLHNWSLWRDLIIIAKTFRVLVHKNAF